MARIFLSYRREDSRGSTGRLYDRLLQYFGPDNLFRDVDTIGLGVDFVEVIEEAVGSCDALLAVIGRQWLDSTDENGRRRLDDPEDFVRLEIETALGRNVRVIPILMDDASMPRSTDLPEALRPLARRNALKVGDQFHPDVDRLIETLEQVLGVDPSSPGLPTEPSLILERDVAEDAESATSSDDTVELEATPPSQADLPATEEQSVPPAPAEPISEPHISRLVSGIEAVIEPPQPNPPVETTPSEVVVRQPEPRPVEQEAPPSDDSSSMISPQSESPEAVLPGPETSPPKSGNRQGIRSAVVAFLVLLIVGIGIFVIVKYRSTPGSEQPDITQSYKNREQPPAEVSPSTPREPTPQKEPKYNLTIIATPEDSTIRIMNIEPKYKPGIALLPDRYDVLVERQGYQPSRQWITLPKSDLAVKVTLEKMPAASVSSSLPPTFTNSIGMEFVLIQAGEFMMGTPPEELDEIAGGNILYRESIENEAPQHQVTISKPFYMGKYEVTQAQWQAVMKNNPSKFTGDPNRPVENIDWNDVQAFTKELNKKEGKEACRLPTEAEWEYATRAGRTTRYSFGDDAGQLGHYAWYSENAKDTTHAVGKKKANDWGLHDMHGNVLEWVQDWYGPYAVDSATDPLGPGASALRVIRGGGWHDPAPGARAANRDWFDPGFRSVNLGFRCSSSVPMKSLIQPPPLAPIPPTQAQGVQEIIVIQGEIFQACGYVDLVLMSSNVGQGTVAMLSSEHGLLYDQSGGIVRYKTMNIDAPVELSTDCFLTIIKSYVEAGHYNFKMLSGGKSN